MGYSTSTCHHIVNEVPAPGNFHPMVSSGHFPFSASETSDIGVDTSALDTAFTSDVASSVGLQLPPDNGLEIIEIPSDLWRRSRGTLTSRT
ncbi:hypothetical protein OROMI_028449 [Orobanche minor]